MYEVLDDQLSGCEWPVPPSVILLHLPFKEVRADNMTREQVLRETVRKQRKWRNWEFVEMNPRVKIT